MAYSFYQFSFRARPLNMFELFPLFYSVSLYIFQYQAPTIKLLPAAEKSMGRQPLQPIRYYEPALDSQLVRIGSTKSCILWRNITTLEEYEEYSKTLSSKQELEAEIEQFFLRLNQPNIVRSFFFRNNFAQQLCHSDRTISLFLERIPYRLSDFTAIPYPDVLRVYQAVFQGFMTLLSIFGPFLVTQSMVGFSVDAKVKVWCNANYSSLHAIHSLPGSFGNSVVTEQGMVQKVLYLIGKNTEARKDIKLTFPDMCRVVKADTFKAALKLLNEYSDEIRMAIPTQLESVRMVMQGYVQHDIDFRKSKIYTKAGYSDKNTVLQSSKNSLRLDNLGYIGKMSPYTHKRTSSLLTLEGKKDCCKKLVYTDKKEQPLNTIEFYRQNSQTLKTTNQETQITTSSCTQTEQIKKPNHIKQHKPRGNHQHKKSAPDLKSYGIMTHPFVFYDNVPSTIGIPIINTNTAVPFTNNTINLNGQSKNAQKKEKYLTPNISPLQIYSYQKIQSSHPDSTPFSPQSNGLQSLKRSSTVTSFDFIETSRHISANGTEIPISSQSKTNTSPFLKHGIGASRKKLREEQPQISKNLYYQTGPYIQERMVFQHNVVPCITDYMLGGSRYNYTPDPDELLATGKTLSGHTILEPASSNLRIGGGFTSTSLSRNLISNKRISVEEGLRFNKSDHPY